MTPAVAVRRALGTDALQMARVHVDSWRQTYRGLMADSVLDDPGLLPSRERFWTGALADERYRSNRIAVAEVAGAVIGIARSGPALDADATWSSQLYVLYVDAAHHGSRAGPALLDTVLDPHEPAALWVADPDPRAQAFYRKHGFIPDGCSKIRNPQFLHDAPPASCRGSVRTRLRQAQWDDAEHGDSEGEGVDPEDGAESEDADAQAGDTGR